MNRLVYCLTILALVAGMVVAGGSQDADSTEVSTTHDRAIDRFAFNRLSDAEQELVESFPVPAAFEVELTEEQWRARLDDFSFYILRQHGTERPYTGELLNNTESGTYYSKATGEPLFHTRDKYDSRTGWPSFTQPIRPGAVRYRVDRSYGMVRLEVVDSLSGSHLGHVFADGPDPTGLRYCMNSAAMIFVADGEEPPQLITSDASVAQLN